MLGRLVALVVLAALILSGYLYWKGNPAAAPPTSFGEVGDQLKDTALTGAVRTALGLHKGLSPHGLSVSTENLIVTLRGEVPSDDLRAAAGRVAEAVPDVKQVVNQIKVTGGPPQPADPGERTMGERLDDEALEVQVRMAFTLNKNLKGTSIHVESRKREILLRGEVSTAEQKKLALETARETSGVKGVTEALSITGLAAETGDRRSAVEQAIRRSSSLQGTSISVASENGQIVLSGRVRSAAERDLAGLLARDAAGGRGVENRLEIRP